MCVGFVIGIPDAAGNATGASFLDMLLIVAAVVGFILLGAYGIYLYQSGQTRYRHRIVDKVLTARTGHIQDANKVYEQDNAELSEANRKLNEVNQSLALANDSLALTNVQLSHSNRSLEIRTIELRDALEINKEILGVTAHDLKNPISGIIGLAEIVHEDLIASAIKVDPDIIEHVELIKVAAEQVFGTVLDLLERHQLGGARTLRREFADLNEVVLSVLSWNRQTAIKKGIGLHFLPINEVIPVNIDVLGIQRVIDNLISNAVKYSMPGADVWLEIKLSITRWIPRTSILTGITSFMGKK